MRSPSAGPLVAPGLIDVHVHGWGGHDATGDAAALSGMARALLRRGVTSFLPTAPSLPESEIPRFAARVRDWMPSAPADGAEPLGFNLEGPFIAPARKGAHDPALLRTPASIDPAIVDASLDGLRIMTIAPELPGALALIGRLAGLGIVASMGHSAATPRRGPGRLPRRRQDHDPPVQRDDAAWTTASPVSRSRPSRTTRPTWSWSRTGTTSIQRCGRSSCGPSRRAASCSSATRCPWPGLGDGPGTIGGLDVVVHDGRVTLVGTDTLAGSVIAIDMAVRNLAREGVPLPVGGRRRLGQPGGAPGRVGPGADRGRSPGAPRGAGRRPARPPGHAGGGLGRGGGAGMTAPRVSPPLDPGFRPMSLAEAGLRADIAAPGTGIRVALAVEQPAGSVWHRETWVHPPGHPDEAASHRAVERLCKFLLWSRGGARLYVDGPAALVSFLRRHYAGGSRGGVRRGLHGPEAVRRPVRGRGRAGVRLPARARGRRRPRPPPRRMPDRLRPRRQRPQGRRRDRRRGGVQRGDPLGPGDPARIRSGTSTRSWTRSGAPPPTCRGWTPSAAARPAPTWTTRCGRRRSSASVPPEAFEARVRGLFHELRHAWGGHPVRGRERRRGDGAGGLDAGRIGAPCWGSPWAPARPPATWTGTAASHRASTSSRSPRSTYSPRRPGRRVVRRSRLRRAVLLAAGHRPPDGRRRHRRRRLHAAAGAARPPAGAHGGRRPARGARLPDRRHLPRLRAADLPGALRPGPPAAARTGHDRVPAGTSSSRPRGPCSRPRIRSPRRGSGSTSPTNARSATARPWRRRACPRCADRESEGAGPGGQEPAPSLERSTFSRTARRPPAPPSASPCRTVPRPASAGPGRPPAAR